VVVENMEQVVELVNLYAPEHLVIKSTKESPNYTSFHNAGCIFTGDDATVVLGDYVSGPSHALPTGGTARFSSPLNVAEFIRYYNVVDCSKDMFNQLGPLAATIARAEGLTAHAAVIENRMKESGSKQ
jgi:histidinol dehydrogenase